MRFDAHQYRFPSRRALQYGSRGMVCTAQPLAAQAGLDMLKAGGNAVDAAVATAITLTVVEPVSNGIGGDAFALVWTKGELHGLNASGPAPAAFPVEEIRAQGDDMPQRGWIPITVPGVPSAWRALSRRFGRLPFEKLFEPAIGYARNGFPVSPEVARQWEASRALFSKLEGTCFRAWHDTFTDKGKAPAAGGLWRCPDQADTLERLATSGCDAFYRGELAERIDRASRNQGGYLRGEDLAAFRPQWVTPLSIRYRGYDVWEIPPNGHGLVALEALGLMEGLEPGTFGSPDAVHRQIEAMKLAFADGLGHIGEPSAMAVSPHELLAEPYLASRRRAIGDTASLPTAGDPRCGGTVYLCAADGEGNMVSYIQSNYMGFGSGVVVPGTGIALHNRGANFNLLEGHPNCVAPGKRPYHTIIPGFLTKNGRAVGPFGLMGAFMQPQGHLQVIMNCIDYQMNPQEALDAPRWQWTAGRTVELEEAWGTGLADALRAKGHDAKLANHGSFFGRGQIIWRGDNGVLCGATEPRADGAVALW